LRKEVTKEFIRKTTPPHPCPLPPGERVLIISHPLRGGDEGEGDACVFTNDRVSKSSMRRYLFSILWLFVLSFSLVENPSVNHAKNQNSLKKDSEQVGMTTIKVSYPWNNLKNE
jgi:hypothetical protein